ncbi:ornithine decarboxylase 1 [Trichonephila inaurata madagascariensis]|uniref:Ornithine decarboxylase 1 n=1 Tax=Trichonephila inaurata madagascariensis TaxID=2747483 RepID=A0A8X6XM13_9ARAC|nr:ornithine decarboxylase 1 [Trichonephila inaurata madagascariensis]
MDVTKVFANDIIRNRNIFDHLLLKSSRKCYKAIYNYLEDTSKTMDSDRSFYILDLGDILWKTQLWHDRLPNVVPYYAVKANADPILMRLFVLLGYGFDCSTEGEIRLALNSGADPKKIIFAHTIKTRKALEYASSVGIDLMTFDCKEELLKISKDFPSARLILRLKSDSKTSVYNLNKKFGCDLSEVENLLLEAKSLNLNVTGVSFHVGALCESPETYISAIENSRMVFSIAERNGDNGIQREYYLNDGFYGSFPYFYRDYDVKHIPLLTSSEIEKRPKYKSKVWGQTCCCEDVIMEECLLPEMEEGQLILWKNMGAYIRGVTSNFTLVPYPADRYIFIQNPRLKLDCIPNLTEVSDYIAEVANLIEQTEDMSRFSLDL